MNIAQAIRDPNLFGPFFSGRQVGSWKAWSVFLNSLFALPMTAPECVVYRKCTGRKKAPTKPATEAWLVVGRRGGKSFIVALIAVFLATFRDYSQYLAPGERGVVMVLAADRKQARVVFRYIVALVEGVAMLRRMVERKTADAVDLNNRITIEIHTASFRSTRGYTLVAALLDEVAYWRSDDSANPDHEVVGALRPAMATIPGAVLLGLSSPYRRAGALFEAHRDHFGRDGDPVLVWQADTATMNPTVPEQFIKDAYARDPAQAAAEFGAQFRADIVGFLLDEWISGAVIPGRHELPPIAGRRYQAFCDPSGGARDAFTLAIAHREASLATLDVCRGRRPPFSPQAVVREYAGILKSYGLNTVTGDKYAGQWVPDAFKKEGINYIHSERNKSELYLEIEPAFATGQVELPDLPVLHTELRQLERRTMSGGRDRVDHPPGGHDDYANVAAGAFFLCREQVRAQFDVSQVVLSGPRTVIPMLSEGLAIPIDSDDEF